MGILRRYPSDLLQPCRRPLCALPLVLGLTPRESHGILCGQVVVYVRSAILPLVRGRGRRSIRARVGGHRRPPLDGLGVAAGSATNSRTYKIEIESERRSTIVPRGNLRSIQDCEDFLQGCLLLGTGGGGSPEPGMRVLSKALADGVSLGWVDADDIPDEVWSVHPCGTGSIAPISDETLGQIEAMGLVDVMGDDADR